MAGDRRLTGRNDSQGHRRETDLSERRLWDLRL